jgi:pSer/pThr/pTyr-binding forkhead associated (FHA) protein
MLRYHEVATERCSIAFTISRPSGRLLNIRVARIIREDTLEIWQLPAYTRVGREGDNDVLLLSPWVSVSHACICWTESARWEVRDLGSRNGTFVNGVRLRERERRVLHRGDRIAFGDLEHQFRLDADDAPSACARHSSTGRIVWSEHQMLTLQGVDGKQADIYENSEGDWIAEVNGEPTPVDDGSSLQLATDIWVLSLPRVILPTLDNARATLESHLQPLGGIEIRIAVSGDQEYIVLTALRSGQEVWRSDRAHNDLLLALARARLADQNKPALKEGEHGWVHAEILCKELGFSDIGRLNVGIYRARTEFARAGIPSAPCIIERRRGTGQLRIGTGALRIL